MNTVSVCSHTSQRFSALRSGLLSLQLLLACWASMTFYHATFCVSSAQEPACWFTCLPGICSAGVLVLWRGGLGGFIPLSTFLIAGYIQSLSTPFSCSLSAMLSTNCSTIQIAAGGYGVVCYSG